MGWFNKPKSEETCGVVDVPTSALEKDKLGFKAYVCALAEFLKNSDMPITVALQGDWGSGKTSMMSMLKNELCRDISSHSNVNDEDNKLFHSVWIRSWEHTLSEDSNVIQMNMLNAMLNGIREEMSFYYGQDGAALMSKAFDVVGKIADTVGCMSGAGSQVSQIFASQNKGVINLKNAIQDAVTKCLKKDADNNKNKKGFVFFIDDLDRLNPKVAVRFLELLKNIFDMENCIYVLAIDYNVVIKGLVDKFGEYKDETEHEFRAFFDKIIQLPFRMPTEAYKIDNYVSEQLKSISFLSQEDLEKSFSVAETFLFSDNADDEYPKCNEIIAAIVKNTTGSNPRSIKRMTNALSLMNILIKSKNEELQQNIRFKLIIFCLVAIQSSYPELYSMIPNSPKKFDFTTWDEQFAKKQLINSDCFLDKNIQNDIFKDNLFDDKWEQIIYAYCQKTNFLKKKSFNISKIFNILKNLIDIPIYTEYKEQNYSDDELEKRLHKNRQKEMEIALHHTSVASVDSSSQNSSNSDNNLTKEDFIEKFDEKQIPIIENMLNIAEQIIQSDSGEIICNVSYQLVGLQKWYKISLNDNWKKSERKFVVVRVNCGMNKISIYAGQTKTSELPYTRLKIFWKNCIENAKHICNNPDKIMSFDEVSKKIGL